ncbi:MAG: TonB-dependent receptor [Prevotella sp.]|jgi:hypothetical protein|nr:TonB-dependent receptor [Prevotella sp.]MCI1281813.1 TonB-dependent receptor [Prevotella sp.]
MFALIASIVLLSTDTTNLALNRVAKQDTLISSKEVNNRNVMLNAAADNQPRQISIGLPDEDSAIIFEDGLPTTWTWWPMMSYFYWVNSNMYKHVGMKSLSENTITTGAVNYSVDSWTQEGGDKFEGNTQYTTNIFGLQRFSVSLLGPIGNGWDYMIGTYINHDPGANKIADAPLQKDMKQFKVGITKTFNKSQGQISLFYKYNFNRVLTDANGPFVFVGDGNVKEYAGFRLGKDGFLPANGQITYMDVVTGNLKTIQRNKGMSALSNDLNIVLNYHFSQTLQLNVMSKYHYANIYYDGLSVSGIGKASVEDGYTYAYDTNKNKAGETFTGDFATRYLMREIAHERAWYNTAELKDCSTNYRHNWRLGFNFWWVMPDNVTSSGIYSHTVEVDPYWLYHHDSQGNDYNTGGEYYDTHETKIAFYASDDWQANGRLWLSAGLRLEYHCLGGNTAFSSLNASTQETIFPENVRSEGWNLTKAAITLIKEHWLNPSITISGRYNLSKGFGILAESIYSVSSPTSPNFGGANKPNTDAIDTYFGNAGLFWNNKRIQLISQLSYIKKTNYQRFIQFINPTDASDIVTQLATYGIETLGWTTDAEIALLKGFRFHGLFTIQEPKFKDFDMNVKFKDGKSTNYNFNGNITTGVSKIIIELDPSYEYEPFRLWLSFRYQSKQYINRTNSLYFNGRWETFAGLNYKINKRISFSLNLINLFNQKGASGNINSADLVQDASSYHNYLMAGTYIRPFTVEFIVQIRF